MANKIGLDPLGRPYLTKDEASVADNLRTLGVDTGQEVFDVSTIEFTHHDIRQNGSYIVCRTPGHNHGYYIGPNKELVRMPDGSLNVRNIA